MYYVGICDDGENTCSELESMVFFYAEQKKYGIKNCCLVYRRESLWVSEERRSVRCFVFGY